MEKMIKNGAFLWTPFFVFFLFIPLILINPTKYALKTTAYKKAIAITENKIYNVITTGGEIVDIEIKIDPEYKIPKIIVLTDKMTDEINYILSKISEETPQIITGFRDNILRILEQEELIRIYSSGGKIIAVTEEGEFFLRKRLYEMEEQLDKSKFVRISNSEIINLSKVKNFDLNLAGTIRVSFCDSAVTYVSRRYVSKIKKILGV